MTHTLVETVLCQEVMMQIVFQSSTENILHRHLIVQQKSRWASKHMASYNADFFLTYQINQHSHSRSATASTRRHLLQYRLSMNWNKPKCVSPWSVWRSVTSRHCHALKSCVHRNTVWEACPRHPCSFGLRCQSFCLVARISRNPQWMDQCRWPQDTLTAITEELTSSRCCRSLSAFMLGPICSIFPADIDKVWYWQYQTIRSGWDRTAYGPSVQAVNTYLELLLVHDWNVPTSAPGAWFARLVIRTDPYQPTDFMTQNWSRRCLFWIM